MNDSARSAHRNSVAGNKEIRATEDLEGISLPREGQAVGTTLETGEDVQDEESPVPYDFLRRPHRYPEEVITLLFMLGVVAATLLGIVFRYVVGDPQSWTEPLARYCLVWLTFMGAAVAVKYDLHMAVELPTEKIPPTVLWVSHLFIRVLQIVLFAYLVIFGFTLAQANTTATTVPGVDRNIVLMSVSVSSALMLFHTVRHFAADIRRR